MCRSVRRSRKIGNVAMHRSNDTEIVWSRRTTASTLSGRAKSTTLAVKQEKEHTDARFSAQKKKNRCCLR